MQSRGALRLLHMEVLIRSHIGQATQTVLIYSTCAMWPLCFQALAVICRRSSEGARSR